MKIFLYLSSVGYHIVISPTGEGYDLYSHGIIACYTVGPVINICITFVLHLGFSPLGLVIIIFTEKMKYILKVNKTYKYNVVIAEILSLVI